MALTKGEKGFAAVAVVAVLVAGGLWVGNDLVGKAQLEQHIETFDDFKWQHAKTYQQGETIRCNTEEDEGLIYEGGERYCEGGWPYFAGFDWDGTMNIAIEGSWLFDDAEDACAYIDDELDRRRLSSYESVGALLVKVRMENVDATPRYGVDRFNITGALRPSDWCYFSGAADPDNQKLYYEYDLAPGDTKEFYLVSELFEESELRDFQVNLGCHGDYPEKITIQLNPKDMRGGGAA